LIKLISGAVAAWPAGKKNRKPASFTIWQVLALLAAHFEGCFSVLSFSFLYLEWPWARLWGLFPRIENLERIDGKLILQGVEDGYKEVRDGAGWRMAISEETGKMVLTESGNQVGFVVFGACVPR